jgi:hypothetical protein
MFLAEHMGSPLRFRLQRSCAKQACVRIGAQHIEHPEIRFSALPVQHIVASDERPARVVRKCDFAVGRKHDGSERIRAVFSRFGQIELAVNVEYLLRHGVTRGCLHLTERALLPHQNVQFDILRRELKFR